MKYSSKPVVYYDSLGSDLRAFRKEKKLTLSQVGKLVDHTSGQFISNIERNLAPAPLELLVKLHKIYEFDWNFIVECSAKSYKQTLQSRFKEEVG